jgi:hypothetical protein
MKIILAFLLMTSSASVFGQTDIYKKYQKADSLLQAENLNKAYNLLKEIEIECDKNDTLYDYILWYYVGVSTAIENDFRDKEMFDSSLQYGLATLKLIERSAPYFDEKFGARKYWMTKNIIVSYFGLGQIDNAKKYKTILYDAYKNKKLPEGIEAYFNFTFFKWEDKNVWGYEWFEELPKNRMSKSFSKIVYYIYSTNADGSDKDQLYRLHVLMFHKIDPSIKFDYVLEKNLETATHEKSGTLYAYTYNEDIDYAKLQADIKEVLKGNYQAEVEKTNKKKD